MVFNRKFKHAKEDLLSEGKKIVSEDRDSKYVFRVTLVNLVLGGAKPSEIADYSGVNERTISGWVAKVDENGFESLRAVKQTGRPTVLSDAIKEEIKCVLLEDPEKHGYRVWDGPTLSEHILKTYGIVYKTRSCQMLLHELGFNKIRPQVYPSTGETDDGSRTAFKESITQAYGDPSLVVVFQDEVHFNIQTTVTWQWAPVGSKPKVKSRPGRKSVAYSGFVNPKTGELWVDKPGWFNFETTIGSVRRFLGANPLPDGIRYCIVMDNAPWHKKAQRLIKENKDGEYGDILDRACFINLPPYSPDLNPIEQVWRLTRREQTHNRYFPSLAELSARLDGYFDGFRRPNDTIHALCCFKWMVTGET